MLALVIAVGAALLLTSGDDEPTRVAADESSTSSTTTTTAVTTSTTFQPGTTTSTAAPETTTSTTTTTTAAPTTTVVTDERHCTQINALTASGLSGELCLEGIAVRNRPVHLRLTARDGDARVRDDCGSPTFTWGDEGGEGVVTCAIGCAPSSGPTEPSAIDVTREHVYDKRGTYDVEVTVESNCGEGVTGERQTFELRLAIDG